MSTYTQILYQIVFSTKHREHTLTKENRPKLFKYLWGILQKKKCHLYRINGIEDHLHIVMHLHPSVAVAFNAKDHLVEYVKNQEEHHRTRSSKEELIALLKEHQVVYDIQYLE